eukprot:TRINITY_DN556_c0_g1_i1.p1 TRINITY_DN556_c0_g1~~TRINITY_DN556_c0_g1_i1.p1  ORF type:complete len:1825 (+),score=684.23 TRINITY_DN556_c0_g1_i1:58-5532(+)
MMLAFREKVLASFFLVGVVLHVSVIDGHKSEVIALKARAKKAEGANAEVSELLKNSLSAKESNAEEAERQQHEAQNAKTRVKDLEVELGNLRMLQHEAQRTEEELDTVKQKLRVAEENVRRLTTSVEEERVVSSKSEEALQMQIMRSNGLKAELESCQSDSSKEEVSSQDKAEKIRQLEGQLELARAEGELKALEAMEEAEKAKDEAEKLKDMEQRLDEQAGELKTLRGSIAKLKETLKKYEGDEKLLIEDKGERRKALLDEAKDKTLRAATDPDRAPPLEVVTWNVAAVNNNPFEYWITGTDEYNSIMEQVAKFISDPGANDVEVVDGVFTDVMWEDLKEQMAAVAFKNIDEVDKLWQDDFKGRKIISQFMKDPLIGKKRLASYPDRYTNTITTASGVRKTRPTVINCFSGDLSTQDKWWSEWKKFMFKDEVQVLKKGRKTTKNIYELLKPISSAKYPALSEAEEKISLPLQVLAAAIFDATLVHMMNTIAPKVWETTREEMCEKLNRGKNDRVVSILNTQYKDADMLLLQEVSSDFDKAARKVKSFGNTFETFVSQEADEGRGQNSYVLLKNGVFSDVAEVSKNVLAELPSGESVAAGDLFALTAKHSSGVEYLLASFHGDTNGLATIPVVKAMHAYRTKHAPQHKLIFGMDANTYEHPAADLQGLEAFAEYYRSENLTSCYGDYPDPTNYTTFHARTHLQPQLNKAVSSKLKDVLGDKNPKDHILFYKADFVAVSTAKDNTGERTYTEGMVFPTLKFPSDHGITSTRLKFASAADQRRRVEQEALRVKRNEQARLEAVTWNIAAVNNNPFEYWIDGTPEYNALMEGVAKFITDPEGKDVRVKKVFTQTMWEELKTAMAAAGMTGVDEVDGMWVDNFSDRLIISEFMKDADIGKKRLASYPDRYTNTIEQSGGNVMRPTVINCYEGDLGSSEKWWAQWKKFIFETEVTVKGTTKPVHKLLKTISRSKYPAVTEAEEAVSIPLQTLAAAIFDAVLVHMMNTVAPGTWQELRKEMCEKLNKGKSERAANILETTYRSANVAFLQEVSPDFEDAASSKSVLSHRFDMYLPADADAARGQNSMILLKKHEWSKAEDVTAGVTAMFDTSTKAPLDDGDLVAVTSVWAKTGKTYLLASFHGDTNGLATIPVVNAFHKYAESQGINDFIFGLDANSHAAPGSKTLYIQDFARALRTNGLTSCYGDHPNPHNYTTFHARTHLQPQLNKAVALSERDAKGDKNPKDHIVFPTQRFVAVSTAKDNTGERTYTEGMVFPTLKFPSDHGITSTVLEHRVRPAAEDVPEGSLMASTWNVAAVNNNPFEYWITGTDEYNALMDSVANVITNTKSIEDVPVKEVFTPTMWSELRVAMDTAGMTGLDEVAAVYESDFKDRKIVSEFLKDKQIGAKRLASMPDRVSNTIRTAAGDRMRPTVINCYDGDLSTMQKWWAQWTKFMFTDKLDFGNGNTKHVYQMLKKISHKKYSAISEEEEAISIPLQTMAGAIFDAILVHMMNDVAPKSWEAIRAEMCDKLNRNKGSLIADILDNRYYDNSVVFLQEVGSGLVSERVLQADWAVHIPVDFDTDREQNSVILLKKHEWFGVEEVHIDLPEGIAKGDLFVLKASRVLKSETGKVEKDFLLASFHGDTDGMMTIPVVKAVKAYADEHPERTLLFGMDANTYEHPAAGKQDLEGFAKYYTSAGLSSCYGDSPDPTGYTTFHARTYLQPQLNKAVSAEDRDKKGDKNPKDHILFSKRALASQKVSKDNTGKREYVNGMVFPTLTFPSDHGITTAMFREANDAEIRAYEAKVREESAGNQEHATEHTDEKYEKTDRE